MTLKVKYIGIGIVIAAIIGTAFGVFYTVKANPSFFVIGRSTAAATSTVAYMNAGTATTTLIQPFQTAGNTSGMNSAVLLLQFTGSSTASTINVQFEYASAFSGTNCETTPTSCDWYRDALYGAGGVVSTSTTGVNIGLTNVYTLQFASTTVGGAAGTATRTTRAINVQTPAQYVRAVITMPIGSLGGAVWAEWLPVKQTQ